VRGKIGLHDGLQRCNAQRADLVCVGEGSREYRPPFGGCLLPIVGILPPIVGLPAAVRGDAWNESCWCLALYKNRHWNEAKEASEQSVEGTLINWRFLCLVLKTRWKIFYIFSEENCKNIWWFQKLVVPLQRWKWRVKVKSEESSQRRQRTVLSPLTSHHSPLNTREAATRCSSLQKESNTMKKKGLFYESKV